MGTPADTARPWNSVAPPSVGGQTSKASESLVMAANLLTTTKRSDLGKRGAPCASM